MSMTDAQMDEALQTLGIKPADMVRVRLAPTYAKRKAALDAVQQQAKIGFRRAALRLHPDRTGGDAAKTEEYLRVQKVADTLLAWGLSHATGGDVVLEPLDDSLEDAAREVATGRARGERTERLIGRRA